jgi:hypothetical protein
MRAEDAIDVKDRGIGGRTRSICEC